MRKNHFFVIHRYEEFNYGIYELILMINVLKII